MSLNFGQRINIKRRCHIHQCSCAHKSPLVLPNHSPCIRLQQWDSKQGSASGWQTEMFVAELLLRESSSKSSCENRCENVRKNLREHLVTKILSPNALENCPHKKFTPICGCVRGRYWGTSAVDRNWRCWGSVNLDVLWGGSKPQCLHIPATLLNFSASTCGVKVTSESVCQGLPLDGKNRGNHGCFAEENASNRPRHRGPCGSLARPHVSETTIYIVFSEKDTWKEATWANQKKLTFENLKIGGC